MKDWKPAATGQDFAFTRILKPLEPFRQRHHGALRPGQPRRGEGSRAAGTPRRPAASSRARRRNIPPARMFTPGVTFDQVVAQHWAAETFAFRRCKSAARIRAWSATATRGRVAPTPTRLSWKDPDTPLAGRSESAIGLRASVRRPSTRAFLPRVRARRALYRKSILDHTREDAQRLMTRSRARPTAARWTSISPAFARWRCASPPRSGIR